MSATNGESTVFESTVFGESIVFGKDAAREDKRPRRIESGYSGHSSDRDNWESTRETVR